MDDSQKDQFERLLKAFHEAQARGDFAQAESIGIQCLVFAAEEAARNPSASLRLVQEAHEHEDAARWEQTRHLEKQIEQDAECQTDHEPRFRP
jgi:hypothetical protein